MHVTIFGNTLYICQPILERLTGLDRGLKNDHFGFFPVAENQKITDRGYFES